MHGSFVNRPNIAQHCCALSVSSVKEGNVTVDIRSRQQNINDQKLVNDKAIIATDWHLNMEGHLNCTAASLRFVVEKAKF